jgi:hypothetical protein
MNIAVLGSGHIGAGLARAWAQKGHTVLIGARDPASPKLAALAPLEVADLAAAVKPAEVVVLAVPFGALDEVLAASGDLAGKVVIDCTNALERGMRLVHGHTTSAAEELQRKLPGARVVKSFNAQGAENLARPAYAGVAASNFYCGDDPAARRIVHGLVADAGFDPVDAGPLENARLLEPLMLLWVAAAQALGTRDLAFKLLRR